MNEIINKYIILLKKPKTIVIIGIAGILLILLSSVLGSSKKTEINKTEREITAEEYKAILEEDIKKTVRDITGSKNISVVITLESGIKYAYADIKEETLTETQEKENTKTDEAEITVKPGSTESSA